MNGPYCARRPEEETGMLESEYFSGIADGIPMALKFPFTVLNACSVLEGPLNSGVLMVNSRRARDGSEALPSGILPVSCRSMAVAACSCSTFAIVGLLFALVTARVDEEF
jgi:hypothetical protein